MSAGWTAKATGIFQNAFATRRRWLDIFGPFVGLIAVIAVFAIISGSPAQFLLAREPAYCVRANRDRGHRRSRHDGHHHQRRHRSLRRRHHRAQQRDHGTRAATWMVACGRDHRRHRCWRCCGAGQWFGCYAITCGSIHRHLRDARHRAGTREVFREPANCESALHVDK